MFTGIVENIGIIHAMDWQEDNLVFTIQSDIASSLRIDESVSHNGICLTITNIIENKFYTVCAIAETILKTNIGKWRLGNKINLEQALQFGGRLDGHLVQGHVDTTLKCIEIMQKKGSCQYVFAMDKTHAALVIEKGSICINGISLTCFDVKNYCFTVAVIPYTYENTNIKLLKINDEVNVEFDVIGKYILRANSLKISL
jgi:riboflavin synthase